ncbi:MAG: hypothetical protein ACK2T6_03790 [Anaerolineae bacterium]
MLARRSLVLGLLAFAAIVASLAIATQTSAQEADGNGHRRLVIRGEITAVGGDDSAVLLTISRGTAPDGSVDTALVSVGDATRVVPRGATPAEGMRATALVTQPTTEGDPYPALVLVLKAAPERRKRHVCGEISALPDDPQDGAWTVTGPDGGEFTFEATAKTRISPRHVQPEVGGSACVYAYSSADGWEARSIQVRPAPNERSGSGDDHRAVHVSGEVAAVSDDGSVWTIDPGEDEDAVELTVDEHSKIVGLDADDDPVGLQVDAVAKTQSDGTLLATTLRFKRQR